MELEQILTAITNIGFPIAACIALFIDNRKTRENHANEMKQVTEALNNNTNAINLLSERMKENESR